LVIQRLMYGQYGSTARPSALASSRLARASLLARPSPWKRGSTSVCSSSMTVPSRRNATMPASSPPARISYCSSASFLVTCGCSMKAQARAGAAAVLAGSGAGLGAAAGGGGAGTGGTAG